MPRIGRMHRKYVKEQFGKLASGQSLVDDREKVGFERKINEAQQQTAGAQARVNNEAAMAAQGQPAMAGQMKQATQQIAGAGEDAAIKTAGASQQFEAAVNEQRKNQVLASGERLKEQNRKDLDTAFRAVEVGTAVGSILFGGGGG